MNVNVIAPAIDALKILVVEDDVFLCAFYRKYLELKGAIVVGCLSLAEAELSMLQASAEFDVILLDNHLEDGDGITLLPKLTAKHSAAAVIMVSGNDDPEFFLAAFNAGIHDYMVKPVNRDLLWLKISKAVKQQRLKVLAEQQRAELLRWVDQEHQQQKLAKHLFNKMFHDMNHPHPAVHAWVKSHSLFSGDAILRCQAEDGSWYFMLADAMGHGLAPAISLMPLLRTFHAMALKAIPLSNIVFELNDNLNRLLPEDRFTAAVLIRYDPRQHFLEVWNGGMPDVQLLNRNGVKVAGVPSRHMALGILTKQQISVQVQRFSLLDGDIMYFMMFSDGLTETILAADMQLHAENLPELINWQSEQPLQRIKALFKDVPEQDDVSLCLVNCLTLQHELDDSTSSKCLSGDFDVSFTLCGLSLLNTDLAKKIADFLKVQNFPIGFVQRVFTVLTELYVNALEHGVLGLNSALKTDADGFVRFYEEKDKRMMLLNNENFISFNISWIAEAAQLHMCIADSGEGFVNSKNYAEVGTNAFGRGLALIQTMVSGFDVIPPGNSFKVVMSLNTLK